MTSNPPMPRKDRLRGVVILCCSFARNLAYYRVGWRQENSRLLCPAKSDSASFWSTVNGNFIDMCVLDWCKLFADESGKHYWRKVVRDAAGFNARLLCDLGLDEGQFQKKIDSMRKYRDKFVAHLDADRRTDLPTLDAAKKSVWFYHDYIVSQEAKPSDLAGLPVELDTGYKQCEDEAKAVHQRSAL